MKAPKKGDEVRIRIHDHIKNDDALEVDLIYGRVHCVTPDAITLDWWALEDPDAKRDLGDSCECVTLSRGSILEIAVVRKWEVI